MTRFILGRILAAVPVLLIVSVVVFMLMHITPGDPAAIILGPEATREQVSALRQALGLDRPLVEQYFHWMGGVVQGDLGESLVLRRSVSEAIGQQIWPTLFIALGALLLAMIAAIPAGIVAARKQGRLTDLSVISGAVLGTSLPSFLLGLLLIMLFSVKLNWLPSAGYTPPNKDFLQFVKQLIMPAAALAAMQAAIIARMTRTAMIESMQQNFVTVARSKGLSEATITLRHGLRNSSLPILTVVAQSFGLLISGSIVIETVFNIPGLGQLVINSISRRDYPIIQGVVLVIAVIYVGINLVVDVLYGLFDPRVRVTG